jgi:hypothetical protein
MVKLSLRALLRRASFACLNDLLPVAFWKRPITSFGGFLEALERPKFWSGRPIPTAENSPMDVTEQVSVGTAETSGEETERNVHLYWGFPGSP